MLSVPAAWRCHEVAAQPDLGLQADRLEVLLVQLQNRHAGLVVVLQDLQERLAVGPGAEPVGVALGQAELVEQRGRLHRGRAAPRRCSHSGLDHGLVDTMVAERGTPTPKNTSSLISSRFDGQRQGAPEPHVAVHAAGERILVELVGNQHAMLPPPGPQSAPPGTRRRPRSPCTG